MSGRGGGMTSRNVSPLVVYIVCLFVSFISFAVRPGVQQLGLQLCTCHPRWLLSPLPPPAAPPACLRVGPADPQLRLPPIQAGEGCADGAGDERRGGGDGRRAGALCPGLAAAQGQSHGGSGGACGRRQLSAVRGWLPHTRAGGGGGSQPCWLPAESCAAVAAPAGVLCGAGCRAQRGRVPARGLPLAVLPAQRPKDGPLSPHVEPTRTPRRRAAASPPP